MMSDVYVNVASGFSFTDVTFSFDYSNSGIVVVFFPHSESYD